MGIFNNDISNILQYFTFPLEIVGLCLAAIEVRFPNTALQIQTYFENELNEMERIVKRQGIFESIKEYMKFASDKYFTKTRYIMWLSIVLFSYLIAICFIIWRHFIINDISESIISFIILNLSFISPIILFIAALFLNRFILYWVPDRSVGTLGILIAGMGVLGESYQFTTLMLA